MKKDSSQAVPVLERAELKTLLAKDLCFKGFYPDNLPPCFNSSEFGEWIRRTKSSDQQRTQLRKNKHNCDQEILFGAKYGGLLRNFSIPSPIGFAKLALELEESKDDIGRILNQSILSASKPTTKHKYRAIGLTYKFADINKLKMKFGSKRSWLLKTDISQFYSSIYTHSIAWAIHGKIESKKERTNQSFLGNKLDLFVRVGQNQETRGIPIGPDSSPIISEIVLSGLDLELQSNGSHGFRFMDDYWFFCDSKKEAEELLGRLQINLMSLRLHLNPSKTRIYQHNKSFEDDWVRWLKVNMPRSLSERDAAAKFTKLITEAHIHYTQSPAIKYIFTSIASKIYKGSSKWKLLLKCVETEPSLISWLIQRMTALSSSDAATIFAACSEQWLESCVRLGYQVEICWILWFASLRNIKLSNSSIEICSRISSSCIALLLMVIEEKGLSQGPQPLLLEEVLELHDEPANKSHWLFRYECSRKGWLDPEPLTDLGLIELFDSGIGFFKEDIGIRGFSRSGY